MNTACPHCNGRYLPWREIYANGAALLGQRAPIRCPSCGGLSHVPLSERNATGALAVLLAGIVLTYPSPLSDALVSGFSGVTAAIVRVDVWAIAVLIAVQVFVLASPLQRIERNAPDVSRNIWVSLTCIAFFGALLAYGVYLYATHAP